MCVSVCVCACVRACVCVIAVVVVVVYACNNVQSKNVYVFKSIMIIKCVVEEPLRNSSS